jgi:nitroreductase
MTMLNIFLNRKTQRAFTQKEVPNSDIISILEAGCSAPSKQRAYPWRVIALTQSELAVELKTQLFTDSFINTPIQKHLLTAKAPLLLAWIGQPIPDNTDLKLISNSENVREQGLSIDTATLDISTKYTIRTRAEKDTMIAASFSMIQAEALGYATAFTSCFLEHTAKEILNLKEFEWPVVFLSIGEADNTVSRSPVIKDNQVIGFSDPRPFPEPPKLTVSNLTDII